MKENKIMLYLIVALFGILGIYLIFINGNIGRYDSQVEAYNIDVNDDGGNMYSPIYYFRVNGKDYKCATKFSSNIKPNINKNIVYYNSKNPEKCATQYAKSVNRFVGIPFLIVVILIMYIFIKKSNSNESNYVEEKDIEKQHQIEESAQKVMRIMEKIELIYKRIVLGIIILILSVIVFIDTEIYKQTMIAKDYIETTATYVDKKHDVNDSEFDYYTYVFKDTQENQQEIIISGRTDETPQTEIKIKYDENNPQKYYEEGGTFGKSGLIWYIVKIIALGLLIILFFDEEKLRKINMSVS